MFRTLKAFFADETGNAAVEYGMIIALVSAVTIGSYEALGQALVALLDAITAELLAVLDTLAR
ncbi:MAG: Flp family type IVb pilin [Kiloniellales bacterium]